MFVARSASGCRWNETSAGGMSVFMGWMPCTLQYMLLVFLVAVPLANCPELTLDRAALFNRELCVAGF